MSPVDGELAMPQTPCLELHTDCVLSCLRQALSCPHFPYENPESQRSISDFLKVLEIKHSTTSASELVFPANLYLLICCTYIKRMITARHRKLMLIIITTWKVEIGRMLVQVQP
jgi:hypothetical protein